MVVVVTETDTLVEPPFSSVMTMLQWPALLGYTVYEPGAPAATVAIPLQLELSAVKPPL